MSAPPTPIHLYQESLEHHSGQQVISTSVTWQRVYTIFSKSTSTDEEDLNGAQDTCGLNYDYAVISSDNDYLGGTGLRIKFNLISSYLSIAIVSVILLAMYMEGRDDDEDDDEDDGTSVITSLLKTTSKLDRNQGLLIPLTVWSGVEQAFLISVFSESFVVCHFGLKTHGLMMITYGLSGSLSSISFGLLRRYVPMRILLFAAALLNCAVLALSLLDCKGSMVIHLCIAAWGIAEGIWQPQIGVVYAETFPEDQVSAFSQYRLWESLGYILIFSLKLARVDVVVIIYIVVTTLAAGLFGYSTLLWCCRREKHLNFCSSITR
ncbi:protein unc-93 homolog A-like [Bolinopsis microptera]|uniref:protein unc-93 homolog A-like n=1 Tax=Bolinopsis microptera TaxID=2820187 RepID=UPI003079CA66